jgi:hypothetical protein
MVTKTKTALVAAAILGTAFLGTGSAFAGGNSGASANEPDLIVGQGVICDTLKQVQRFVALRSDGKEAEEALKAVNQDVTDPNACGFGLVKFTGGQPVALLSINGKPASVLEITVHAFSNGSTWNEVSETVQYILVPEKGLIA